MTDQSGIESPRWQNYLLERGPELAEFWQVHLADDLRHVLFVIGKGFDPRMCLGLKALLEAGGKGTRDVWAIEFDEGISSPSMVYAGLVETNWTKLQELMTGRGSITTVPVKMWSEDRRRIGSRSAAAVFGSLSDFEGYTDIIIDVSAMPRSISFPLIAKALYLLDQPGFHGAARKPNLHIFVSEDPVLDGCIQDAEVDETADYVHGFRGGLEMEATAGLPRVWIPLLGESQEPQLERIYDLVKPDEICPVLPSPSLNPRRGDNLVLEYRELLFDRLRIEPRNFIYASEWNPFEVYGQIRRAILHYQEALLPLRGCKCVISALSTKLMSIGALLVAYELKQNGIDIGVAHVESHGYVVAGGSQTTWPESQSELFGLWLAGEGYEQ